MAYDSSRHHRHSIRLPHYDYAAPGWYFVTICVQGRACLLGEVNGEAVRLNPAGEMARDRWHRLPSKFPHLRLDAFVIMPNHVHGIIGITDTTDGTIPNDGTVPNDGVGADPRVRPVGPVVIPDQGAHAGAPLPRVIQWWKTMSTNAYIRGVKTRGWSPFDRRLWQRNYRERVIRTERELDMTRRYIADNPLRWRLDRLHTDRRMW